MVGFFDLSNELVLMIWHLVELEDIYSFSTVSKNVYLLTQELLREHYRLEHRLCTISNVDAKPGEPRVFGRILKEVLLNPRAARYPYLLRFDAWKSDREFRKEKEGRGMLPLSDLELFKQAARDTVHVPEKELEEEWLAEIDNGGEEPLVALLLFLLPNLHEIEFGNFLRSSPPITETLRDILLGKRKTPCSTPCSLSRLRSVGLKFTSSDDDFLDFEDVRLFASLPSVTSIYGCIVGSDPDDLLHTSTCHIGTTNVTNLSFHKCLVHPKVMSEFLYTTWNLQRFFYSPGESAGNPANFDPFWIRTALLANAGNTLKSLTILAGNHERHFMGSLADFTCLESLETDLRLLIGDPAISFHSPIMILPPSIVNIKLHIKHAVDGASYQASIQEIADEPTCFDELEYIAIIGVADARAAELSHERLILVLEERGTRLSFGSIARSDNTESESDGASDA